MSSRGDLLGYAGIVQVLKELCAAQRSGTLFITTDDNHAVRFVLRDGNITSCHYSQRTGYDALPQIRKIAAGRYSFVDGVFDGMEELPLPGTDDLLTALARGNDEAPRSAPVGPPAAPSGALPEHVHEAVDEVEKELAMFVGPAARMFCGDYLEAAARAPQDIKDLFEMIDELAREVADPEQEKLFKRRARAAIAQRGAR